MAKRVYKIMGDSERKNDFENYLLNIIDKNNSECWGLQNEVWSLKNQLSQLEEQNLILQEQLSAQQQLKEVSVEAAEQDFDIEFMVEET